MNESPPYNNKNHLSNIFAAACSAFPFSFFIFARRTIIHYCVTSLYPLPTALLLVQSTNCTTLLEG